MMHKQIAEYKTATISFSIVSRLSIFLLIWWVLTNGVTSSWWFGVPAVLLALITSLVLMPPMQLVWLECIKFIPFFIKNSFVGGTDVAWRAFHPRLPITPALIEFPMRLPPGLSQVFMANIVNLLPGTLSASLDRNIMKVHVLDSENDFMSELEQVEQSVARVFGVPLDAASES